MWNKLERKKKMCLSSTSTNLFNICTFTGNDMLHTLPDSPIGSLVSITSSEHDPQNFGADTINKRSETKIINEEWWLTTVQVSIPFLIAGIGTIGAGILLGVVEVSFS